MYTYMLCLHLCLVRATVPGITSRCTIKIVHVIRTTISHFDASWVITAIVTAVKTHRPGDLTVCYCGVSTIWPAGIIGTTPSVRYTWCCHSCAGRPLETEPSRAETVITVIAVAIRRPSGSAVETPVVLTFWHKSGERTSVASNVSFSCTSARSPHVREPKTILDSQFHAVNSGFSGTGFQSLSVELGFWI